MIENRYDDFKTEVKSTNRKWKINWVSAKCTEQMTGNNAFWDKKKKIQNLNSISIWLDIWNKIYLIKKVSYH